MKFLYSCMLIAMLGLAPSFASADDFDITVVNNGGFTASQFATFTDAVMTLESIIDCTDAVGFGSMTITATGEAIDGVGGTLGSAGPTGVGQDNVSNLWFTTTGAMTFDTADIANLENNGSLNDVILHEMMHVVGIGTLWSPTWNNLLTTNSTSTSLGQYTGANALAAYNAEFGLSEGWIPVENDGSAGTRDGHWDEEFFGVARNGNATVAAGLRFGPNRNELMTGFINTPTSISQTTRASFVDLGYKLNAVPEPGSLAVLALLGTVVTFRRRRS